MAIDPICGMSVDESSALPAVMDGHTYYFCSEHCRQQFIGQPSAPKELPKSAFTSGHSCCSKKDNIGDATEAVKPSSGVKYYCPMCPGVESEKPGDCPKCGMALERNPAWKPQAKTIYTCPMHPEVEQDHPGECPKCGMALEPHTVTAAEKEEENSEFSDMTQRFWIGAALTRQFLSHAQPTRERFEHGSIVSNRRARQSPRV